MNQPLISVIIPVYKVEAWLDACVQSVLAQTYQNLEIILVDDGSPDSCGAMCDRWAETDDRVHVLHKKNGGLSSARNAGIEIATGDYIMFLDSDDVVHPQICEHLYYFLSKHNAKIAACDLAHIFPEQTPPYTLSSDEQILSPTEAIAQVWYQTTFLPSACAKLYHRSIFQRLRFTCSLLFEDVDLMHQLLWEADTVVYTPSALYGYNHREQSITTNSFSIRDLDILKVADKILNFAQQTEPSLLPAAQCYACVAALRVQLNAPRTPEFADGHATSKQLLSRYAKSVSKDPHVRKKTKYGLLLYRYCRPLMSLIYKRINRWK